MIEELRSIHPDLRKIQASQVIIANWVRFKCRYGCPGYGKHLCCPPFAPSPDETRRVLAEYQVAVLAKFQAKPDPNVDVKRTHHRLWSPVMQMHKTVFEMERRAFLSGCYKAFGMYALPCTLCETCVVEEKIESGDEISLQDSIKCRHKDMMRPSMEACGIDVFQTIKNAGYETRVLNEYHDQIEIFGMILLD